MRITLAYLQTSIFDILEQSAESGAPKVDATCEDCGQRFTPPAYRFGGRPLLVCRKCRNKRQHQRLVTGKPREWNLCCLRCDQPLPEPKERRGTNPRFCVPCRKEDFNERRRTPEGRAYAKRIRDGVRQRELARRPARYCTQCNALLSGLRRKFCSLKCNKDWIEAEKHAARVAHLPGQTWPIRACDECGDEFIAKPYSNLERRFCSNKCGRRNILRKRTKVRRAITRTLVVFEFDPIEIFDRDGWTCQACGIETPRELKGSFEPNAPELDHIEPLSRGGVHAPENCQCLCKKCNAEKSDRTEWEWQRGIDGPKKPKKPRKKRLPAMDPCSVEINDWRPHGSRHTSAAV